MQDTIFKLTLFGGHVNVNLHTYKPDVSLPEINYKHTFDTYFQDIYGF